MVVNQVASLPQLKSKTSPKQKPVVDDVRDHGKLAVRASESEALIPFQSRVVWSPLFDERPPSYQFSSMYGLKRISSGKFSDAELPAGWRSAEQTMRQLIPYSSDVKVSQEYKTCRMERQYTSSSDEERQQATDMEREAELWGRSGRQPKQLYEDITENKKCSSDRNGDYHRGGTRNSYGTVASASSGCSGLSKQTAKRSSRKTDRPTKAPGKGVGSIQRPWDEGSSCSVDFKREGIPELAHTFTFTSSRSNKGSDISTGKISPTSNVTCKTGSNRSTGSGGIGRGRISNGTSGKENKQPELAKLEEEGDNIEKWEKITGCPHLSTYKNGAMSEDGSVVSDCRGKHCGGEASLDDESLASVSCSTVTDVEKDRQSGRSTRSSRERRSRRRTRKRSETPADVVASAASMIGDTVEAVRRVRKDAAELAFKLAELHAHDAKALRTAAAVMCEQVDQLQDEVEEFEATWSSKEPVYPLQDFLREFFVTVSLISGAFSLQTFLTTLRRAARDGFLKQTVTRKEKMIFAAVVLSLGARFGNEVWQGLNQVTSSRKARQGKLYAQFKAISQRVTMISAVSHSDPTIIPIPGDREVPWKVPLSRDGFMP